MIKGVIWVLLFFILLAIIWFGVDCINKTAVKEGVNKY